MARAARGIEVPCRGGSSSHLKPSAPELLGVGLCARIADDVQATGSSQTPRRSRWSICAQRPSRAHSRSFRGSFVLLMPIGPSGVTQ